MPARGSIKKKKKQKRKTKKKKQIFPAKIKSRVDLERDLRKVLTASYPPSEKGGREERPRKAGGKDANKIL